MREWFLSNDLIAIQGMPNSITGISQKARREGWKSRKASGGGRSFEFHISNFSEDVRNLLEMKYIDSSISSATKIMRTSYQREIADGEVTQSKSSLIGFDQNVEKVIQQPHGAFPLISWVQAGDWSEISLTSIHEADHYPCPVKCSKNTFLLKVIGKSMNPTFTEGELIFVDPEIQAVDGKYVVARLDDENQATFKQLIIEDGHKFLQAANPNWPTPIQAIKGNCTIVGVVISSMKLFS